MKSLNCVKYLLKVVLQKYYRKGTRRCLLVIGLQGYQPREVQAASLRSPKNVSSFADTFFASFTEIAYRVVQLSITRQSILFRAHQKNSRFYRCYRIKGERLHLTLELLWWTRPALPRRLARLSTSFIQQ